MPPKSNYDSYKISETGNWNVAADYVKLKIMKFLYLVDELEIICTFGYSDILQELTIPVSDDRKKIVAFKRLVKYLLMLIRNTEFAIRKQDDKEAFKKSKESLENIELVIPALYNNRLNKVTKQGSVNLEKERFEKVLLAVIKIKSDILTPLNNSNLIFTPSEEFDPHAYKKKLMEDASNLG